jgi:predicted Na+-dependent transporter
MDIPSPPLLLIGMEGLWGTILCVVFVYPLVYFLPGDDHGSYENPFNTWHMFIHETHIQVAFAVYFVAIFGYNFFAVLVTYLLNSVWHAILDNFRPITVWMTDLFIFYVISTSFGEQWTIYSWIQVAGMCVLLYGTAVYNGPNAGSIILEGKWYALGMNFSSEYQKIKQEEAEKLQDDEWKARMLHHKMGSSFFGEIPPSLA